MCIVFAMFPNQNPVDQSSLRLNPGIYSTHSECADSTGSVSRWLWMPAKNPRTRDQSLIFYTYNIISEKQPHFGI